VYLDKIGKKNSILIGYVTMVVSTVGIGVLSFCLNYKVFISLAVLMRGF